ncbi:MAG: ATP-binding protein [Myxococcota bacterium]|nr:ATP-binding protein [Myxococcota bacterium]
MSMGREPETPCWGALEGDRQIQSNTSLRRSVESVVLSVTAEWHVAQAQNVVRDLLKKHCFSSVSSAYIVTAVSELATNLFFHTTHGGSIKFDFRRRRDGHEVVVVCEDDGPGISNLDQALLDGFSTNGGLGGGLPGIERLMDEFEIESRVGSGTRVTCRKWSPWK